MSHDDERAGRAVRYTGTGLVLGAGSGIVAGLVFGASSIALGIVIGAGVGLVIGAVIDARRRDPDL